MGHNPATRNATTSERKKIEEKRTPEAILLGIRGNLVAHLSITPSDIAFLLAQHDLAAATIVSAVKNLEDAKNLNGQLEATINALEVEIDTLKAQVAILRDDISTETASVFDHGNVAVTIHPGQVVGFLLTSEQAVEAKRVHEMLQDHGGEA